MTLKGSCKLAIKHTTSTSPILRTYYKTFLRRLQEKNKYSSMNTFGTIFMIQPDTPQVPEEMKVLEEEIEKELLDIILKHLEDGSLELEKAQEISKEYLALLPFHDKAELLKKLGTLSEKYKEAQSIFAKIAGDIEKEDSARRVEQMSQHIKNGDIEQAIKIAKGDN